VFYAGNNDDVCRGALVIAAAAIEAEADGYVRPWAAKHVSKYLAMLANEMLGARGAGYFEFETHARLQKISDIIPDDESEYDEDWEWPSLEETRRRITLLL
jgi:hypothetical protein